MAKRRSAVEPAVPALVWSSPLFDPSGYADEARNFLLGLNRLGIRARANPITWNPRTVDLAPDDGQVLHELTQTPVEPGYMHVQHIFPTAFKRDPAALASIGRTMYETDRIPTDWVAQCNVMDQIWVPSDFNLETFARA